MTENNKAVQPATTKGELLLQRAGKLAALELSEDYEFCCEKHRDTFFDIKSKAVAAVDPEATGLLQITTKALDWALVIFKGEAKHYTSSPSTGSKYQNVSTSVQCVATTFEEVVDEEGNKKTKPVRCIAKVIGTPQELSEKRSLCDTHFEVKATKKKAPAKKTA